MTATDWTSEASDRGRYADLNGLHLYYEVHGTGRPLVLLHGGLGSGGMFGPVVPRIVEAGYQVVAPDLQGHGRTADIDRPLDVRLMADDIAALIKHPELVNRLVVVSANVRRDAIPPEMLAQQAQMGPEAAEFMKDTPMYQGYVRVAPRPEDFPRLLGKIGASMAQDFDWSEEVRGLQVPTLIAAGDADMAPPSHYVEVFKLLDGGLRDGGWMGEGRPKGGHALAIIPNATHYNVFLSPLLAQATLAFLAPEEG
jgi:pimeloyl-ACP methyl ester carboxylesterase